MVEVFLFVFELFVCVFFFVRFGVFCLFVVVAIGSFGVLGGFI